MRKIKKIVLHCTANNYPTQVTGQDIDVLHRSLGWKCCGYHYVINTDGSTYKGRPEDMVGAHAKYYGDTSNKLNRESIGIAYVGGLVHGSPTNTLLLNTPQMTAFCKCISWICKRYGLSPVTDVILHNEIANKACPSFNRDFYKNHLLPIIIKNNFSAVGELEFK